MFEHGFLDTCAVLDILYACVLYVCIICTCSVQLSMFHMVRGSKYNYYYCYYYFMAPAKCAVCTAMIVKYLCSETNAEKRKEHKPNLSLVAGCKIMEKFPKKLTFSIDVGRADFCVLLGTENKVLESW